MVSELPEWDSGRFLMARLRRGHDQTQCAERLKQLGHVGADQTAVSEWENGKRQPRASTQLVLERYIAESPGESVDGGPTREQPGAGTFEDAVRDLTHEPLLGELQREFVLALIKRHGDGPALTQLDDDNKWELARLLGLASAMGSTPAP